MEEQRIKDRMNACVCCGSFTIPKDSRAEICDVCTWQDDDPWQNNPNRSGGANKMSLNEARKAWAEGKPVL